MMTDTELASVVHRRVDDALGTYGDQLSALRIRMNKEYHGDEYGDEVEGRSKVVTHDVAEAVDSLMPPLLKVFLSGDKVVMCEPVGPEDEEAAEQATDYLNHIFLNKNDGFRIVYTTLKDGLLSKTGVAKVWWDDTEDQVEERYLGLTQEQVAILQGTEDIEVEVEDTDEVLMGIDGQPLFNVVVTKTNKAGKCCIEPVAPEEFLIDRYAVKLSQATPDGPLFTAHRQMRMVSDVVAEFPDKREDIEAVAGVGDDADRLGERRERHARDGSAQITIQDELDMATRPVWVIEAYVRIDYDEDGIAELRKVTCVGETGYRVIDNEIVDDNCFAAWSPTMMPHKFHGKSVAEDISDLQRVNTTLMRGMLNNLYYVNEPMTYVNSKANVNIDALLNRRVGGIVEGDRPMPEAVSEMAVPPMMQFTLPVLEYISTLKEQRTGVTRYSQGLDAEALNKTARGIQIIQDASQQRQELIARCYAEVFMKRIFALILKYATKYSSRAEVMRIRGQWVTFDPRAWKNNYDMTVTVGLGTGNRDQQAVHAMNLLNVQKELLLGGKDNMVTDANLYNTLEKMVAAIGWKSAEPYFTDPSNQPQQPKPPPVDPRVVEIQGKQQLQAQKEQMDHQFRLRKEEMDAMSRERDAQREHALNLFKAELKAIVDTQTAEQQGDINLAKAIDEIDIKRFMADNDNEIKRNMATEKEGGASRIVMMDVEGLAGLNDSFDSVVTTMKQHTTTLQSAVQQMVRPKEVSLDRDRNGRVVGGTVKTA